ncbi:MAG: hypothetical protein HZB56_01290 [Deltaproteobacteria bacterium]|nr:hypothetical protein [Deltaproteobacteria bacterium]
MRIALAFHLALAAAAVAVAFLAWAAAAGAERGQGGPFARRTGWLGLLILGEIIAGSWVLGFVPLARGQRLFGGDGPGTAALVLLLLVLGSAMRLAWTAHRRPRPRRVAGLLLAHLAAAGLLMAVVVQVLRRPIA